MLITSLALFIGSEWNREHNSSKANHSLPTYYAFDKLMYSPFLYPELVDNPVKSYDKREFKCLSDNIYHEARGEGDKGMRLVGHVTLNRALSSKYPSNLCKVVYQSNQFSWTSNPRAVTNRNSYQHAQQAARDVLYRKHDESNGALFFFGHHIVTPKWYWYKTVTVKHKNHTFMK